MNILASISPQDIWLQKFRSCVRNLILVADYVTNACDLLVFTPSIPARTTCLQLACGIMMPVNNLKLLKLAICAESTSGAACHMSCALLSTLTS